MRAIETLYKGYRFRSRLEARWAVFFDALGITWQYEPEGFVLDGGDGYLPDFLLPSFCGTGMYVEVKHEGGDFSKTRDFAKQSELPVWLAEGVPSCFAYTVLKGQAEWRGIPNADQAQGENRMFWEPGYEREDGTIPESYGALGDHYLEAVRAARSARFEHGETPQF